MADVAAASLCLKWAPSLDYYDSILNPLCTKAAWIGCSSASRLLVGKHRTLWTGRPSFRSIYPVPCTARDASGSSNDSAGARCMAPEEDKMTKRSPLDFPVEWVRPAPGRRPDIFPQFSPMKTPLPQPLPADPPEEDGEEEEEKEEEEEDQPEKEKEKPPKEQ